MNKTALITGSSSGIGAVTAEALAENGYNIVLNYNSSEVKAKALTAELCSCGYNVICVKCDVGDSTQVKNMFDIAREAFGSVDLLVNNAGIAQQKLFTDITDDDWNKMISVNLTGVFNCSREALTDMIRKKQGKIINISSMWGQVGASCEVHYSASKAGVIGLTKALAKETGPSNIQVNCICPGVVDTPMMASFGEEDRRNLCDEIPLGRFALGRDIADTVVFLASEKADYITGQIIGVNGGFVI